MVPIYDLFGLCRNRVYMANIMQYLIQMSDEARGYYQSIMDSQSKMMEEIDTLKARIIELEQASFGDRED